MKNRICLTLLLSTVIAISALAQQGNSSSSTQPAASAGQATPGSQGANASGTEPERRTDGDFWEGDEPGAAWLILHPFASKGYVRRSVQPVEDRVNELDQTAASHARAIQDLDSSAQHRIQLASAKAKEGDQHALEASNKSQKAQQAASAANTHLSRVETVVGNIDQYKSAKETVILFRPGQSVLSKAAKDALDEMATPLKDQHGYVIEVQGFSSGRGQAAIAASRKRADSVVRYLVQNHGLPAFRIHVVGMGNAPVSAERGTPAKRTSGNRVEIGVLKNDLGQLASTSESVSPK